MPDKHNARHIPGEAFHLPAWRSDWQQLHSLCEDAWHLFLFERKKGSPGEINSSAPDEVMTWCLNFQEQHGRLFPAIVGAAALFRRYFTYLVSAQLPEAGTPDPYEDEAFEQALAGSLDWRSAVEFALADVNHASRLIAAVRPDWNLTPGADPLVILRLMKDERERQLKYFKELTRPQFSATAPKTLAASGYTLFPTDRINKAVIEALAHGALKTLPAGYLEPFGVDTKFWRAYPFGALGRDPGKDRLIGAVGWREKPDPELWKSLRKNRALAVKIQFALWARALQQGVTEDPGYVTLTVPQFCDDLRLTRHGGSHRQDRRLAVVAVLKLLTSMEMVCVYQPPNEPPQRIRGPVWKRIVTSEAAGRYVDLFAEEHVGGGRLRASKVFSYSPGPFFSHHTWAAHNRFIARVSAGFLELTCSNRDKWAVNVGAYLSILARINGYRRIKVNVQTLLEKTGLWAFDRERHPERMQHKLENALDRLVRMKVIRSWARVNSATDTSSDTIEDDELAGKWLGSWLSQLIIVDWVDPIKNGGNPAGRGRRKSSS